MTAIIKVPKQDTSLQMRVALTSISIPNRLAFVNGLVVNQNVTEVGLCVFKASLSPRLLQKICMNRGKI
jgi:hypothetical protein